MLPQGKFIVLEGGDGNGKTSQAQELAARLSRIGVNVWLTREPTDAGEPGQKILAILAGKKKRPEGGVRGMQLLYVADRFEHNVRIGRKLESGIWVVCSRHHYSTVAYAVAGDSRLKKEFESFWPQLIRPDLAVFMDLDPQVALGRIDRPKDFFEQDLSLQMKIHSDYIRQVSEHPELNRINAYGTPEEVAGRIWELVLPLLPAA